MMGLVYSFSETEDDSRRSSSLRTNADTKALQLSPVKFFMRSFVPFGRLTAILSNFALYLFIAFLVYSGVSCHYISSLYIILYTGY